MPTNVLFLTGFLQTCASWPSIQVISAEAFESFSASLHQLLPITCNARAPRHVQLALHRAHLKRCDILCVQWVASGELMEHRYSLLMVHRTLSLVLVSIWRRLGHAQHRLCSAATGRKSYQGHQYTTSTRQKTSKMGAFRVLSLNQGFLRVTEILSTRTTHLVHGRSLHMDLIIIQVR